MSVPNAMTRLSTAEAGRIRHAESVATALVVLAGIVLIGAVVVGGVMFLAVSTSKNADMAAAVLLPMSGATVGSGLAAAGVLGGLGYLLHMATIMAKRSDHRG